MTDFTKPYRLDTEEKVEWANRCGGWDYKLGDDCPFWPISEYPQGGTIKIKRAYPYKRSDIRINGQPPK